MKKSFFSTAAAAVLAGLLTLGVGCAPKPADPIKEEAMTTADIGAQTQAPAAEQPTLPPVTEQPEPTGEVLDDLRGRILTKNDGSYSGKIPVFDINVATTMVAEESKSGDRRTFEFAGQTFDLTYVSTTKTVSGDRLLERYDFVKNGETRSELVADGILFTADGAPLRIDCIDDPISLNISEKKNEATLKAAAEELVKDMVDLSRYELCETIPPNPPGESHHYYEFCWFNEKNGIRLRDSVTVSITPEGEFWSLVLPQYSIDVNEIPDEVSLEAYMPEFEQKLAQLYGNRLLGQEVWQSGITTFIAKPYKGMVCLETTFLVSLQPDADGFGAGEYITLVVFF